MLSESQLLSPEVESVQPYLPQRVRRYTFFRGPELGFPAEEMIMIRRKLLSTLPQLFGLSLLGLGSAKGQTTENRKPLKIMMKSAWGSDDPTRASFPFAHGLALSDAGHEVQIFLLGEATYLMRKATAAAIFPIGWPPLTELLDKVVAKKIPVFA
jgi:hypothetical protein